MSPDGRGPVTPSPVTRAVRSAATTIAEAALGHVQDRTTRAVRVEDYLTTLAALTGEAAFLAAGVVDIEHSDLAPGSPVFGDQANVVLSGDTLDLAAAPLDSVLGILVRELVPGKVPLSTFGSIEVLYAHVAGSAGAAVWGSVAVSVPDANQARVLPLQVAFELRPVVDAAFARARLPANMRHVPPAVALADAIKQVQAAIDLRVGVLLALEVVFGTAKLMPMSRRAFDAAT